MSEPDRFPAKQYTVELVEQQQWIAKLGNLDRPEVPNLGRLTTDLWTVSHGGLVAVPDIGSTTASLPAMAGARAGFIRYCGFPALVGFPHFQLEAAPYYPSQRSIPLQWP